MQWMCAMIFLKQKFVFFFFNQTGTEQVKETNLNLREQNSF